MHNKGKFSGSGMIKFDSSAVLRYYNDEDQMDGLADTALEFHGC